MLALVCAHINWLASHLPAKFSIHLVSTTCSVVTVRYKRFWICKTSWKVLLSFAIIKHEFTNPSFLDLLVCLLNSFRWFDYGPNWSCKLPSSTLSIVFIAYYLTCVIHCGRLNNQKNMCTLEIFSPYDNYNFYKQTKWYIFFLNRINGYEPPFSWSGPMKRSFTLQASSSHLQQISANFTHAGVYNLGLLQVRTRCVKDKFDSYSMVSEVWNTSSCVTVVCLI